MVAPCRPSDTTFKNISSERSWLLTSNKVHLKLSFVGKAEIYSNGTVLVPKMAARAGYSCLGKKNIQNR